MEKQFTALTPEQLLSAERGDLKLKYRNGCKVMQLVWLKEPYVQDYAPLISIDEIGNMQQHELCGCDEQPAKYGGQLTGVPVEIVEFMLDQQEAQGNKRDASVFESSFAHNKHGGGFDWWRTSAEYELQKAAGNQNYEPMLEFLKTEKR